METLERLKLGQLIGQRRLKLSGGLAAFPLEILNMADSLEVLDLSGNCFSSLPEAFSQLKRLKILFLNNNRFKEFPAVLAECPALSMISFKHNQIEVIGDRALSPTVRWLILTDNRLKGLPSTIGKLSKLQKLMLAGNQLQSLPDEMANCHSLELIRLSVNQLQALPAWLFSLPRLAWLAYAGNPCCQGSPLAARSIPTINEDELQIGEVLGQGASGVIYKGLWAPADSDRREVAVKLFKGEITSDGLPVDEMRACVAAGSHPSLVTVLGKLSDRVTAQVQGKAGLIFSCIPSDYTNLGNPPDLDTCTRDTYREGTSFELPMILRILRGIASAIAHLHGHGILHGDLYAHNILINDAGESFLGDFGAASFYRPSAAIARPLERLEVRAFGCLIEDLLNRCVPTDGDASAAATVASLRDLQRACMHSMPTERPLFAAISEYLTSPPISKSLI
ncbi:MAG: leucine-rich repeat-containing protein kinase family protein [Phormidesmis sp.]